MSRHNLLEKSKLTTHYKQLTEYRESLLQEAENIVLDKFPKKVLEFNAFLESERFSFERLSEVMPDLDEILPLPVDDITRKKATETAEDNGPKVKRSKNSAAAATTGETVVKALPAAVTSFGTPVYGFLHGSVPCNSKLALLMDEIRPLLREAVEDVNKVKVWILFLIPRIEDGNNFGVSIQEECLNEVRNVESEAASFLDQMSRYFVSRARLITKIAKYPHVDDYRRAILDTDEKQFLNIRLVIMEMRNHFATLHDLLTKNMDKIKTPRSNNMESMY